MTDGRIRRDRLATQQRSGTTAGSTRPVDGPRRTQRSRPIDQVARLNKRGGGRGRLRLGSIDGRLAVAVVTLFVVMSLFAGRLFQLQILRGSAYAGAALANRAHTFTLPAARGQITDDTGAPLAATVAAYDIIADPTVTKPYSAQLAAALAIPLGMTVTKLENLLARSGQYVVLARQVSPIKRDQLNVLIAALQAKTSRADSNVAPVGGIYANPDPREFTRPVMSPGMLWALWEPRGLVLQDSNI